MTADAAFWRGWDIVSWIGFSSSVVLAVLLFAMDHIRRSR